MYYAEQDLFLNAACLLETKLEAWDLLDQLKRIEKDLGRIETFQNGPRIIDLDVLLYGKEIISSNHLVVPHPRIAERAFVLKPLCDILPKDTRHPHFSESFAVGYFILSTAMFYLKFLMYGYILSLCLPNYRLVMLTRFIISFRYSNVRRQWESLLDPLTPNLS